MLLLLPILLYKSDVAGILLFILVSETDFALPGIINSANTSTGAANESRTALGGQKHCTWIYEEVIDHVSYLVLLVLLELCWLTYCFVFPCCTMQVETT